MSTNRKISISQSFLCYLILIGVLSVLSVGYLWITFERSRFEQETRALRQTYVASQKQTLKREVDRTLAFAEYMKSQIERRLQETIKSRVYEAHAIALNLFRQYNGQKNQDEIRQLIKDALRPIRFNNGRGYYFAFNMDGEETLFADKPEMEGKNMLSIQGGEGEFVVADMLALVKEKEDGFYKYTWSKPDREGFFPKIAFVKLVKPINWVIGTGEYLDDVEKDIRDEVLQWISNIRFGNDGYVFAGQWDGLSLSGPVTGKSMLDVTDVDGVKVVRELIKAAKSGGGYVHYTLPEFKGKKNAPKISYAAGLEDWQWYIGAGVYVDEIESVILEKQAELKQRIKNHLRYAVYVLITLLLVILLIVKFITGRIRNSLASFMAFFAQASGNSVQIDPRALHFSEFHDLALSANVMIEKRDTAEKALDDSRIWSRLLLDAIQSGIIVVDASTSKIIDVNQATLSIIGAEREQVIGQVCRNFLCPADKDACPIIDLKEKIDHSEHVLVRMDGQYMPILKSCNSLTFGERSYIVESFLDLTKQKKLEDQLRQAHKLEALGLLAGGVSHDLNNMLSPVIGFSEMLIIDMAEDDPHRNTVTKILSAGFKARDLVHQLLAFGRKQALEIKNIDINKSIMGLQELLRRTIPENIDMAFILDPAHPLVRADAGQLEQVLLNLILNARDAMPDGGRLTIETRRVRLDMHDPKIPEGLQPGDYIQLVITDTGCGIKPDYLDKIFDPFFTTKEKGKGTGLGLAMAYGIVKQHSGSIRVTSTPHKGTSFKVYLPLAAEGATPQQDLYPQPESLRGSETIMVVEDNDGVKELACAMLTSLGYTVLSASGAAECLDVLESHQGGLHLVLSDVVMPDINGKELFEQIKASYGGVKVLFMSGYTNKVIARHGVLEEGFNFIQKPFTVEALAAKVRKVLDNVG